MSHVKYIEIDHVLYFEKRMYEKKKKKEPVLFLLQFTFA